MDKRIRITACLIFWVGVRVLRVDAQVALTTLDVEKIPPSDRLSLVLAALDARDQTLRNCHIELTKTEGGVKRKDGSETFTCPRYDCEYRRLGDKIWMHFLDHSGQSPFKVLSDSIVNWDGQIAQGVGNPPYLGTEYHQCTITSKESNIFTDIGYFELLGTRIQWHPKSFTVAAMLRMFREHGDSTGQPLVVTCESCDGTPSVRVSAKFVDGAQTERDAIWMDPLKNFLIIGRDYEIDTPQYQSRVKHRVLESALVKGVWFPMKTFRTDDNDTARPSFGKSTYQVSKISVGDVTEREVEVKFPLKSHVTDSVKMVSYVINAADQFTLESLYDSSKRVVYRAPDGEGAIVRGIDASTSEKYSAERLLADAPPRARLFSAARLIELGFTVGLVVLLTIFWKKKRRDSSIGEM